MTTTTGILQFSKCHHPDPDSGYTLDDNARALLVALAMGDEGYPLALTYTHYLEHSWQANNTWCNLLLHGDYLSDLNSEDSFGRAFWACSAGSRSKWPLIAGSCTNMLERAVPCLPFLNSARGLAYCLIGLCKGQFPFINAKSINNLIHMLADRLLALYHNEHSPDWLWFEDKITYCNGIMPHALFAVYASIGNRKYLKIAHASLGFLNHHLFAKGYLNIVGNEGWYVRGGKMPLWDQQPVDAASIVFACHEAYQVTGRNEYKTLLRLAYQWYRGANLNGLPLYDVESGGCFDALTRQGVNLNQGAEAALSLLASDLLLTGYCSDDLPQAQSL